MRRKKYLENKSNLGSKNKSKIFLILGIVLFFVSVSAVYFIYKLFTLPKYTFVNRNIDSGKTEIYLVDSQKDLTKKYIVSDNLLLESSLGYGEYNINSLWTLSEKEKVGGKLITNTILKNFNIPVFYYLDKNKTNMNLYMLVNSKITTNKNSVEEIEIKDKKLSNYIISDFVDNKIQEGEDQVVIEDLSGSAVLSENISSIINVLGSKVVDYKRGYDENLDCEVLAKEKAYLTESLQSLFDCKFNYDSSLNSNVKLKVGNKFLVRF